MDLIDTLTQRGLFQACTDTSALRSYLATGGRVAVYAGFDATAPSLHVGHLVSLLALQVFQDFGHAVWPLCGTGTALVGDPTGRSTARPMLAIDALDANTAGVQASLTQVLGQTELLTNDWFREMNLIDFLRDVGAHIPLSHLMGLDTTRRSEGVSVLEAFYPMLQAFDFLHLARRARDAGVLLVQLGGSDQWGNICTGLELIHKAEPGLQAFGLTVPLLTKADGTKMGKSAQGAVWLRPEMCDPNAFWHFWRNVEDTRLAAFEALFGLPATPAMDAAALNAAKIRLATTATARVHGAISAQAAQDHHARVFAGGTEGLVEVVIDDILPVLITRLGFAPSRTQARQLIEGGGVRIDGVPTLDPTDDLARVQDGAVLRVGKKRFAVLKRA